MSKLPNKKEQDKAEDLQPAETTPEDLVNKVKGVALVSRQFTGPIPPPDILRSYEEIVPGSAKIIFSVFQKQAEHRMAIEKGKLANERLGLKFAFWIAITGLLVAAFLGYVGAEWAASILGALDLATLVYAFIKGSKMKQQKLSERANNETVED